MEKKFRITVENTVYTVTVEDLGLTAEAAAASPAPQIVAVAPAPAPAPVAVVADNAPRQVTCRLGGVIQSIEVTVGQMVNTGDKVMIVEAMNLSLFDSRTRVDNIPGTLQPNPKRTEMMA